MSAKGKRIITVSLVCLAALCLVAVFWPKAPVEKSQLLKYIEQEEFQYNRRYIRALQRLFSEGDGQVAAALATKYIDTTRLRLLPDEKRGSGAPAKYRPYLKSEEEAIRFGTGASIHSLFDNIDIFGHLSPAAAVVCDTSLEELQRMRRDGVIDSERVAAMTKLLRGHCLAIRKYKIEHRELTCELLYVYACYEYWPSLRQDVDLILACIDGGRLSDKRLLMVDDEGIENALEYIDPAMLSKFKESGNLHKKAPLPLAWN